MLSITTPTMSNIIDPPIKESFFSQEEAERAIYQHAQDYGYALTRADIKYDKKKPPNREDRTSAAIKEVSKEAMVLKDSQEHV
jgi:hypothetical protein